MAGLDGIKNKIHPGDPADKDLYDLEPEEAKHIPTVCHSLDMALEALDKDRAFLKEGGVFTDDVIDAYINAQDAGSHAAAGCRPTRSSSSFTTASDAGWSGLGPAFRAAPVASRHGAARNPLTHFPDYAAESLCQCRNHLGLCFRHHEDLASCCCWDAWSLFTSPGAGSRGASCGKWTDANGVIAFLRHARAGRNPPEAVTDSAAPSSSVTGCSCSQDRPRRRSPHGPLRPNHLQVRLDNHVSRRAVPSFFGARCRRERRDPRPIRSCHSTRTGSPGLLRRRQSSWPDVNSQEHRALRCRTWRTRRAHRDECRSTDEERQRADSKQRRSSSHIKQPTHASNAGGTSRAGGEAGAAADAQGRRLTRRFGAKLSRMPPAGGVTWPPIHTPSTRPTLRGTRRSSSTVSRHLRRLARCATVRSCI